MLTDCFGGDSFYNRPFIHSQQNQIFGGENLKCFTDRRPADTQVIGYVCKGQFFPFFKLA